MGTCESSTAQGKKSGKVPANDPKRTSRMPPVKKRDVGGDGEKITAQQSQTANCHVVRIETPQFCSDTRETVFKMLTERNQLKDLKSKMSLAEYFHSINLQDNLMVLKKVLAHIVNEVTKILTNPSKLHHLLAKDKILCRKHRRLGPAAFENGCHLEIDGNVDWLRSAHCRLPKGL